MSEMKQLPDAITRWLTPILRASQRKTVVFLCCLAGLGLALLLVTRPAPPAAGTTPGSAAQASTPAPVSALGAGDLALELADILEQIDGAGRVEIRLSLAVSRASEWERNLRHNQRTVEDRTQDGGVQVTSEETEETTLALARRADGSETPVERFSTAPQINGAIVVADGARDPGVQSELARAASAFLGIGLHRVLVFAREVGK